MRKALIIGGSGGIGSAFAAALRERDFAVTTLSRKDDGLDLTDPASVDAVLGALAGPFDLIIVATGILSAGDRGPEKALNQIDASSMAEVFAVNAIGPALVLSHADSLLPRIGRSVLAVLTARVGSIGDNNLGGWYSYRASKAAANQIVHTAAIEIGRKRKEAIVVALHPGTVDTRFTQAFAASNKVSAKEAASNLLGVVDGLRPSDNGGFFDWAGKSIAW